MSKSWRKRLLDSGLELSDRHIRVLKHGPKGHRDRNVHVQDEESIQRESREDQEGIRFSTTTK